MRLWPALALALVASPSFAAPAQESSDLASPTPQERQTVLQAMRQELGRSM